ncbi:MAG: HAD family hydrolase [Lactobacillales bacterium]|jgi:phosphoglycolate phosphatase|nr:HAD family hydrolase [Lactobacillales bacterium]
MSKLILWDWDNTLVDTFGAIFAAQNDMCAFYNLPKWTLEESRIAMSTSGRNLIKDIVGIERAKEARAYYLERYAAHAGEIKPLPGAADILKYAKEKGFIGVLASNKAGDILRNEVQALDLMNYFARTIGAEDTDNDKPSKEFTDAAIAGYAPEVIISIGDGKADIQMARNYPGGIGILVGTDPTSKEFTELKPNHACQNLTEVKTVLDTL